MAISHRSTSVVAAARDDQRSKGETMKLTAFILASTAVATAVPALAHHSFAMFAVNTNLSALESRNAVSRAAASSTYLGESSSPWNAVACRMDVSNAIK
jgi:hypothetical protein